MASQLHEFAKTYAAQTHATKTMCKHHQVLVTKTQSQCSKSLAVCKLQAALIKNKENEERKSHPNMIRTWHNRSHRISQDTRPQLTDKRRTSVKIRLNAVSLERSIP